MSAVKDSEFGRNVSEKADHRDAEIAAEHRKILLFIAAAIIIVLAGILCDHLL